MTDVFIVYTHEDRTYAHIVARALEAEGFTVRWDEPAAPGTHWHDTIAAARNCVVIWSQHALASVSIRDAANVAKIQRKLIPIQVDGTDLSLEIQNVQSVRLQNWNGDTSDLHWQILVREIRARIAAPQPAAAASAPRLQPQPPPQPQAYTPRVGAPVPSETARSGVPLFAAIGLGVAALLAIAALVAAVLPGRAPPQVQAAAPAPISATQSLDTNPEAARLRMERDEALRVAEAERRAREDLLLAQAATRSAAQPRAQRAAVAAGTLAGTSWTMTRRFLQPPPSDWRNISDAYVFHQGGRFSHGSEGGTWRQNGTTFTFRFDGGIQTTYTGTISGRTARGSFTNTLGERGEFTFLRN